MDNKGGLVERQLEKRSKGYKSTGNITTARNKKTKEKRRATLKQKISSRTTIFNDGTAAGGSGVHHPAAVAKGMEVDNDSAAGGAGVTTLGIPAVAQAGYPLPPRGSGIASIVSSGIGKVGGFLGAFFASSSSEEPPLELLNQLSTLLTIKPSTMKTYEIIFDDTFRSALTYTTDLRRNLSRFTAQQQCDAIYESTGIPDTCYICGSPFWIYPGSKITRRTAKETDYAILTDKVDTPHCDHILPAAPSALIIGTYDEKLHGDATYISNMQKFGFKYACRLCNVSKSDICLLKWNIERKNRFGTFGCFGAATDSIKGMLERVVGLSDIRELEAARTFLDIFRTQLNKHINETYRGSPEANRKAWLADRLVILTGMMNDMGDFIMNRAATEKTLTAFIEITRSRLNNPANFTTNTLYIMLSTLQKISKPSDEQRRLYTAIVAVLAARGKPVDREELDFEPKENIAGVNITPSSTAETDFKAAMAARLYAAGRRTSGGGKIIKTNRRTELEFNWTDVIHLFNALSAGYYRIYGNSNLLRPLSLHLPIKTMKASHLNSSSVSAPTNISNIELAEAGISRSALNAYLASKKNSFPFKSAIAVGVGGKRHTRKHKHSKRRRATQKRRT